MYHMLMEEKEIKKEISFCYIRAHDEKEAWVYQHLNEMMRNIARVTGSDYACTLTLIEQGG